MVIMKRARSRSLLALIVVSVLSACSAPSPQEFDSKEWLSGGSSARGSMVQDIIDRDLLKAKTKVEVEQLLGKPDSQYSGERWHGYEVVTISRCYFWTCRLEVGFDERNIVSSVASSD